MAKGCHFEQLTREPSAGQYTRKDWRKFVVYVESMFWMGQALGFVMMAAALGVLSIMATARLSLGLGNLLDARMAHHSVWGVVDMGPFTLASVALSAVCLPMFWPLWLNVGKKMGYPEDKSVWAASLVVVATSVGAILAAHDPASFLEACAAVAVMGALIGSLFAIAVFVDYGGR